MDQIRKNKNPGGSFGATILPILLVNGLDWHCCLAGSSKTTPRILILPIAMSADYSFERENIEIWVTAYFKHNDKFVDTVITKGKCLHWRDLL